MHDTTSFSCTCREAWNQLKEMSNREAMERYIALVSALNPTWESVPLDLSATPVVSHVLSILLDLAWLTVNKNYELKW